MLKIYNLEDKKEYLREVAILEHNEWEQNFLIIYQMGKNYIDL